MRYYYFLSIPLNECRLPWNNTLISGATTAIWYYMPPYCTYITKASNIAQPNPLTLKTISQNATCFHFQSILNSLNRSIWNMVTRCSALKLLLYVFSHVHRYEMIIGETFFFFVFFVLKGTFLIGSYLDQK